MWLPTNFQRSIRPQLSAEGFNSIRSKELLVGEGNEHAGGGGEQEDGEGKKRMPTPSLAIARGQGWASTLTNLNDVLPDPSPDQG